ncbi:MAG: hypothetical protein E6L09_03930 [Verrucomicrobia bacterium]|nr:MAG: hypothetical protein E6L09_03930 [Verrucomicrobiota bacterium]
MKLITQGAVGVLAVVAAFLPTSKALGGELDLSTATSGSIGDALFSVVDNHPTGTGVFDPFLTVQSPGNQPIEQGYNTSGRPLPLDDLRNHWNIDLQVQNLQSVTIGDTSYYVFELDANETGTGNIGRFLSIDNIRIYTSGTGGQTANNPDDLGKLRYSLNDPRLAGGNTFTIDNWVKIDASRADGGSTSGSGSSDLLVYVPAKLFADALPTDFVYFYNLNGVHYAADPGTSADAGFEEWRALRGVPDGGNSLLLLGSGLTALGLIARRKMATNA